MHQGVTGSDEEEILPLGSLQDTLKVSAPPDITSHSRQQIFKLLCKNKKSYKKFKDLIRGYWTTPYCDVDILSLKKKQKTNS